MNWLKRKVVKWVREDWEEEHKKSIDVGISLRSDDNRPESDPVLNFRIYSAENGKVLEFNRYDRTKDRHNVSLYIIGKDEDIAEKVSKCVTLESMK
jgi:hypothetical protein